MESGIIYKCTCLKSNKCYIGKTIKDLSLRVRQHLADSKRKRLGHLILYRAFKKYGFSNFKWEVLCECGIDDLNRMEKHYIKELGTIKPSGYNITPGGDGMPLGHKHSEETKRKIGLSKMGNKYWIGRKHTDETKKKMSDSQKGKIFTDEHKKNMSISGYKRKNPTDETKKKMSISSRKKYIVITPDGKRIEVNGLKNFCTEYKKEKLNPCNLNMVANGKRSHHKGYKCIKMP